ncbi:ComF family protein [Streptomyces amakusaensis]|uniref:ComF family protein n=1 Tax=Streptomyces amakusaensis TaxID=67271 RepID=A0ABW0AGI2_9ACTN
MRAWWREISGLVLPVVCAGCGVPPTPLCAECAAELHGFAARRVTPDPEPPGLPGVHAAALYEDAVRAVLLAHKERGALGLARPLGVALAGAVRAGSVGPRLSRPSRSSSSSRPGSPVPPLPPLLLVPVPSARRAVRARGHDAARRIAFAAARELRRAGTPARVLPVLRQRREVVDQAGLTARERVENLAGALEAVAGAGRLLAGGRTVLVDDLMTTGASLAEAARALRAAGGGKVPGLARMTAAVVAAPSPPREINRIRVK